MTVSGCQGRSCARWVRDQVEQQGRIGRVILGPAGREDFPIPGQRLRIDRIEDEKLILHQRVDHGAFTLLDGKPHRPAGKPLPQLGHPGMQHVGPLLELEPLDRAAGRRLHLHRVLLIAPVQTDVCRQVLIRPHGPLRVGNTHQALVLRKPYSRVLSASTRTTSEDAMSDQSAPAPLERPCQTVAAIGEVDS